MPRTLCLSGSGREGGGGGGRGGGGKGGGGDSYLKEARNLRVGHAQICLLSHVLLPCFLRC